MRDVRIICCAENQPRNEYLLICFGFGSVGLFPAISLPCLRCSFSWQTSQEKLWKQLQLQDACLPEERRSTAMADRSVGWRTCSENSRVSSWRRQRGFENFGASHLVQIDGPRLCLDWLRKTCRLLDNKYPWRKWWATRRNSRFRKLIQKNQWIA